MTKEPAYEAAQMPPASPDAEEACLGSILINPDAYLEVAAFLKEDDFFILRNAWVWTAMTRLHERGELIDYLTLIEELRAQNRLDDIGGAAYVTYLTSNVGTSIYSETYGRIVERAAIRRRMLDAATEIARLARDEEADIYEVIEKAEDKLSSVTERSRQKDVELRPVEEAISEYFDRIEYLRSDERGGAGSIGIPSGFYDLDNLLAGFQKSDLIILAARPGVGKTSFILSVAKNSAKAGAHIAIFTLEMSSEQLAQRLMSAETGINVQKLRLADLNDNEWKLFVEASGRISERSLFINDKSAISLREVKAACRRLKREHGLDMVIIDYLQLMTISGLAKNGNREQEIAAIARGLKDMAKELNVPVIACAQLSRALEARKDKRPVLSDLRESGELEQAADIVMFIYRDDLYNESSDRPNEADIIVAKHRNGPTGNVVLFFRKHLTEFTNLKNVNAQELYDNSAEILLPRLEEVDL